MKIAREMSIEATPEVIWRAISPLESLPQWASGVDSATHVSGPKEGAGRRQRLSRAMYHRTMEIEQEVTAWEPGKRLEMLHVRESSGGREYTGVRNFRTAISLSPSGAGSKVRAEYSWDARIGLPWLLSILFGGRVMGRELKETLVKIEKLVSGAH